MAVRRARAPHRRGHRSGRGAGRAAAVGLTPHARRDRLARAGGRDRRDSGSRSAAIAESELRRGAGAGAAAGRRAARRRAAARASSPRSSASRYEEIDLLYAISEILGQTVRLEEATQTIAREVSTVVGARRASIMVFDEAAGVLRTVAARGFGLEGLAPVPRGRRVLGGRAGLPRAAHRGLRSAQTPGRGLGDCGDAARLPRQGVPERADLLWRAGLAASLRRRHQPDRPARAATASP